jgi:hypothetical protein
MYISNFQAITTINLNYKDANTTFSVVINLSKIENLLSGSCEANFSDLSRVLFSQQSVKSIYRFMDFPGRTGLLNFVISFGQEMGFHFI